MSDKEIVLEAVRGLADDATLEQILQHLAILAAIWQNEDGAAGRAPTYDEIKQRMTSWISR